MTVQLKCPSISSVLKLKKKIDTNLGVAEFVGMVLTGDTYLYFVKSIHDLLPKGVDWDTLDDSLIHLTGQELTDVTLSDEAWRLAGNLHMLKAGVPVKPWTHQRTPEWMPTQIIGCKWMRDRFENPGMLYRFRILAGSACPLQVFQFWSLKKIYYVASCLGFSKPWDKYAFADPAEFVGLRCLQYLDIQAGEKPVFSRVANLSELKNSLFNYNKRLLMARARIDFECPKKFIHECFRCPIGYLTCELATHREDYKVRFCPRCQQDTWFDPGRPNVKICVSCLKRVALMKGEKT